MKKKGKKTRYEHSGTVQVQEKRYPIGPWRYDQSSGEKSIYFLQTKFSFLDLM